MSSSSGVTQERFLTSRGDNGVLPAGVKVISCPSGNCGNGRGVVFPAAAVTGMYVWYKNTDFMSLDPSATPITGRVILGMFNDSKNDGRVDEIIKIAGESLTAKSLKSLSAGPPVGYQEEFGVYAFKCVSSERLYRLDVHYESDRTWKEFYKNRKGLAIAQYSVPAGSCDDGCDDPATCREVACGLVNNFRQQRTGVIDGGAPLWPTSDFVKNEPHPLDLFVMNPINYYFCLDGASSGCNNCTSYTGIKGISIGGIVYSFAGLYGSSNASSKAQMEAFIKEINCTFDTYEGAHQGFAWKSPGSVDGACEGLRITINSCKAVEGLVKYDDTIIAPCDRDDLVFTKKNGKLCLSCGEADNADVVYPCAVGYVGYVAEEGCDCETPSDNLARYYPTHVTIAGDGFKDGFFEVLQKARIPQNTGVQIWQAEYAVEVRPEFYEGEARTGGKWNNRLDFSRSKSVKALCGKNYCFISLTNAKVGDRPDPIGYHGGYISRTNICIEGNATATKTAMLADLNAVKALSDLETSDISCTAASTTEPSPTPSRTPDTTPSVTPSATPSITPSHTKSTTPSVTPSITITPSRTPSITPTH